MVIHRPALGVIEASQKAHGKTLKEANRTSEPAKSVRTTRNCINSTQQIITAKKLIIEILSQQMQQHANLKGYTFKQA